MEPQFIVAAVRTKPLEVINNSSISCTTGRDDADDVFGMRISRHGASESVAGKAMVISLHQERPHPEDV